MREGENAEVWFVFVFVGFGDGVQVSRGRGRGGKGRIRPVWFGVGVGGVEFEVGKVGMVMFVSALWRSWERWAMHERGAIVIDPGRGFMLIM